jgi:hypothetical protein
MNSGFNPKVANPNKMLSQMTSGELQTPFYFGGSQVPLDLGLSPKTYSGSGFTIKPVVKPAVMPPVYFRSGKAPVKRFY